MNALNSFFQTPAPAASRALLSLCLALAAPVHALPVTWDGSESTDFENPANWIGDLAPVNDAVTDTGRFADAPTPNLPGLTASRSLAGLTFLSGGWTLGSSSPTHVLTLGTAGINSNIPETNLVSANLALSAGQIWNTGTGGTLRITGSVSMGTSASPAAYNLIAGGGQNGTLVLDPGPGSSVNLYHNLTASAALQVNKSAMLGSALNSTASTNVISNAVSSGIRVAGGQTLTVNSGTWLTNDLGANNTGSFSGNVILNGGTLASGGGRYLAQFNSAVASTWTINGGTLRITGGGNVVVNASLFGLGFFAGTPLDTSAVNFNLQRGFVDVSKNANVNQIGTVAHANAPMVLMNQSGGTAQFGVTTGTHVVTGAPNANPQSNLLIGNIGSATTGIKAAYTLTGGNLLVAGTLSGAAPTAGGGGVSNFNFTGGTLTVRTINPANLTSSATATASSDQTLVSTAPGTFHQYGGILAPGGAIVASITDAFGNVTLTTTPTTGRTSISGGYQAYPAATLAFHLAGPTPSTVFQDAVPSASYSWVNLTGPAILAGTLSISLAPGYSPAPTDVFKIIDSNGILTGSFANAPFGGTVLTADGRGRFDVRAGTDADLNDVLLTNFSPVGGTTYAAWIGGFNVGLLTGPADDFDKDGLGNAIEQVLGTNPSVPSPGLTDPVSSGPGVFKFRHSRTNAPASDVTPSYQWSADLKEWKSSGQANTGGTTATLTPVILTDAAAPANDLVEVTLTATGTPAGKIFTRLAATKAP